MTDDYKPPRYRKPRWKVPTTGHPCTRELFRIASEEETSLKHIADRAGISWENLCAWKNPPGQKRRRWCRSPGVVLLDAALQVLGYKLAVVPLSFQGTRLYLEDVA